MVTSNTKTHSSLTLTLLAGKIVIAGQTDGDHHVTPVGTLSTQELLAHELAGYWLNRAVTTGIENYALAWGFAGLLLLAVAALPLSVPWITGLPLIGAGTLLAGSAAAFVTEDAWYLTAGPVLLALLGGSYAAWSRNRQPEEPEEPADRLFRQPRKFDQPPRYADASSSLGRYQLVKLLGQGAMGRVYLGRDPKINRMVAIKTINLAEEFDLEDIDEARDRFLREAETAGGLNHPDIVTIYDVGEENNIAYIAMELLRGGILSEYTKPDKLLPVATTLKLVARAAKALDYAHRHNIVHRDIKPANIMYDSGTDSLKLTDFGIARLTDVSRTRTGIVLGTPSFMSPEQLESKNVSGYTDLFALGVSLYQLLTGHLPFRGSSMTELMFVIANEPHRPVTTLRTHLPDHLDAVLDKALAKKPRSRFASGAEMAQALHALAAQAA